MGAQLRVTSCDQQSHRYLDKLVLYDFCCAWTCLFRTIFYYLYQIWQFLCSCTSPFLGLNHCGGIFFKSLSYLYKSIYINPPIFQTQFGKICGAIRQCKWELSSGSQRAITSKKRWKPHQNRPINRDAILDKKNFILELEFPFARLIPTDRQINTIFSYLRPVHVVRSSPKFAWW